MSKKENLNIPRYDDSRELMKQKPPKPTGEWTVERLIQCGFSTDMARHLSDEINAALAIRNEREIDVICELHKQLAAEREKVERANKTIASFSETEREAADEDIEQLPIVQQLREQLATAQGAQHHMEACRALLKVPDDEVLYVAIEELHKQLAAERGEAAILTDNLSQSLSKALEQLAAERKKNEKP